MKISLAPDVSVLVVALACACAGPRDRVPAKAGPVPAAEPARAAAAVHHDLQVTLVPGRELLLVEDAVTLSPEVRARLGDTVVFSLHAGLSPERVGPGAPLVPAPRGPTPRGGLDDADEAARVPVEAFAVTLAPGERSFTVRYGGRVFHPIEEAGEEYARKSSSSPGLVSRDGAVLSGSTRWLPAVSDDLIAFTLEARVPAGWDVVSQGARTRRERDAGGTLVRWDSPEPQDEIFLVAGPFVERARSSGRVLVEAFLRTDDAALAAGYLSAGEEYLSMYEKLLGPYPYAKFALVENFWETGYGMPSFTLLGPRIIRLPFILHSSYPHEILHNWWGNGVFVDAERGNWCEGLTAYLADHLIQEQRGQGAEYRRTSLQRYADYVAENQDFAVREFRARHSSVTQAVGYDKVLMLFHMLRQRMGDERFTEALRRFYAEHRFRAASFSDLGRAMSAAAGEDLAWFFEEWVDRPGAPAIRVESAEVVTRDGSHQLELTLAQTQGGKPYAVDVPVYLTLPSSPQAVRRTVYLAKQRQRFSLALETVPARLDVDPEYDVFRRLEPAELPPALSGAFGAAQRMIVLPSSAPPELRAAYAALAKSWVTAGTVIVSDAELARVPPGMAVWVLGWENRLRGVVEEGVSPYGGALGDRELRVGTTVLSRQRHTVVVATRSPADAAQVVAFVGADRANALPGLGRKLPHYGKYSLLGFEGDEPANVAKETWPVLASPMSVGFVTGGAMPPRAALPPRRALADPPRR
jgi:aminopeptidase N